MKPFQNPFIRIKKLFGYRQPEKLFVEVLREYIDSYLRENDLTDESRVRYDAYYRNYLMYAANEGITKIPLNEFKIIHAERFRVWLKSNLKTCSLRHASRHVELLKRVTKYAMMMEYTHFDTLSPIKPQRDKKKPVISLELSEIKRLKSYPFTNAIYQTVADLFLFQCFTGLSYVDLYKFTLEERNGATWLIGQRSKTEKEYLVYFLDEAREIYEKYNGELPRLANQTYNRILKEMAVMVGFKKVLTTHVGRKTHATILTELGVGTKPISVILGNTEKVCEDDYVKNSTIIIQNAFHRAGIKTSILAQNTA